VASTIADHQYQQAIAVVESETSDPIEKVDMLMEIAMGLQQKPKSTQQILDAIALYDRALELCPETETLLAGRIHARKGTALQVYPDHGPDSLLKAEIAFETALEVLGTQGSAEETAEAEMNLGLVLQGLAGMHKTPITNAINAYQRALRTFSKEAHPTEFAILHNNLATAYLSIPMSDQRGKMREALAVQSFEEALKIVTLIDQPSEYAMLQNNLGNALQYVSSSHAVENNLRALDAYEEALKVRTRADSPMEYANTIANMANCLRNLPDDLEHPETGNRDRLRQARTLCREAQEIFSEFGDTGKASVLNEVLQELDQDIGTGRKGSRDGNGFGESRV